jgi:hypothetical protein
MDANASPFAVLSLIVAPAILTNASSVLAMSTGNRLARAVDRARELSKQLETTTDMASPDTARRMRELSVAEQRALLLLRALQSFYTGLGAFASATLVSLLGAVFVPTGLGAVVATMEGIGVLAGLLAVAALVHGSVLLIQETRLAVQILSERAARVRAQVTESTVRAL